ncbi:MAG: AMP-binding protein, partial [Candidatus Rokuibacteriota bacterium]
MEPDGPRTIRDVIDRKAALQGDAPFIIVPGAANGMTYGQLRDRARALAVRLAGEGRRRVAFLLDNGPALVEVLFGALYGGAVPIPLSPQAGRSHLEYALAHAEADTLVLERAHASGLEPGAGPRPLTVVTVDSAASLDPCPPAVRDAALPRVSDGDDALLAYTSGTTGAPKAAVLTHRGLVAAGGNVVAAYALSAADRALGVLPLGYRGPQNTTLVATLLSGGAVVLPPRFDAAAFWDLVVAHRCTWVGLVPTLLAELLARSEAPSDPGALAHVRFVRSSGAALPPVTHREFEARFGLPLVEAMGATESGSVLFTNPLPPGVRKAGSVGRPTGVEARVVSEAGEALPPGVAGAVLVRGPSVMKAYYKDAAATAEVLGPDGWLRTGDVGYVDDDGYLFVVGRARDLVNKAGVKVAPREIEETLARHPAVLEAAVVGVPDPYLGEDLVAFVVPRPGATCRLEELSSLCEQMLGAFKVPSRIHVRDELPRAPTGKVQRHLLSEPADGRDARPVGRSRPAPGPEPPPHVAPRT